MEVLLAGVRFSSQQLLWLSVVIQTDVGDKGKPVRSL